MTRAELLDEAAELFTHWCWQTGQQDSDPFFDEEYWMERAEEAEARPAGSYVPARAA